MGTNNKQHQLKPYELDPLPRAVQGESRTLEDSQIFGNIDSRVLTHCDKEPLFLSQTIAKVLTIVPVDKNSRTRFRHSIRLPRLELKRSEK